MRPDSCPLARTNGLPRPTGRGYRLPAPALENLAQCGRRCESSTRIRLTVPARYLGLGDALDTDQIRGLSEGDLLLLGTREDAVRFAARHLPDETRAWLESNTDRVSVKFADYDWSITRGGDAADGA